MEGGTIMSGAREGEEDKKGWSREVEVEEGEAEAG